MAEKPITTEQYQYFQSLLAKGDRVGAYLYTYELSGSWVAHLMAQMASYSGQNGAVGLAALDIISNELGAFFPFATGNDLSNHIAQTVFTNAISFHDDSYYLETGTTLLEFDQEAWQQQGIGKYYIGNLFVSPFATIADALIGFGGYAASIGVYLNASQDAARAALGPRELDYQYRVNGVRVEFPPPSLGHPAVRGAPSCRAAAAIFSPSSRCT